MTDLQAGIGIAQLKKLKSIITSRNKIAKEYNKLISINKKIKLFKYDKQNKNAYFFYPILIKNRDKVAKKLLKIFGIDTRIAYPMPIYQQPVYKNKICESRHLKCPNAKLISSRILNLPIFPNMSKKQIKYVVECLNNCLS